MKVISKLLLAALLSATSLAHATSQTFTIGDAEGKRVSQVFSFNSEAQFENITGQTNKVTGSVDFDPAGHSGKGSVSVDIASISTGIQLRDEHLRSPMWFDAAKYPAAVFTSTSLKHKAGESYLVTGNLTVHGVTRKITAPATIHFVPESPATQKAGFKGNVINLKTKFTFKLSDFGVKIPEIANGKVSETITANLNVFGYSG